MSSNLVKSLYPATNWNKTRPGLFFSCKIYLTSIYRSQEKGNKKGTPRPPRHLFTQTPNLPTHTRVHLEASPVRHRTMRQKKKKKNARVRRRRNHKGIRLLVASHDLLLIQICTDPFRFPISPTPLFFFLEWGLNHIEQINEVNVMI